MKNKKALGIVGVILFLTAIGFIAYFAGKNSGTQENVVTTETSIEETTTESPSTEVATEEQELDLLEIYNPKKYYDSTTGVVTRTEMMYTTCNAYNIRKETHYIDDIIDFIITEIEYLGETTTNEQVENMLNAWAVDGKILTEEEFNQMTENLENYLTENESYWNDMQVATGTRYATTTLNIRRKPNSEAEKVGSLAYAESVEVQGLTGDGKWYWLYSDTGEELFASAKYLSETKPEPKPQSSNSGGSSSGGGLPAGAVASGHSSDTIAPDGWIDAFGDGRLYVAGGYYDERGDYMEPIYNMWGDIIFYMTCLRPNTPEEDEYWEHFWDNYDGPVFNAN